MDNKDKKYFLPYQNRWIVDESPLKIYKKSRRIGITYGTSYRCVRKCLKEEKGSNFTQWVSSRDMGTAKEFITDYVAMWAKAANVVAKGTQGDNIEVLDESKDIKAFVVEFDNGSRIVSLSSNPYAFAGKGGDILLDEFDLHKDQELLFDMAFPCITWGGQLEIVSAFDPNGSEHTAFATLIKEVEDLGNPKKFSLHCTDLDDAIGEGFVEKVNEIKARKGKPTQTREEFREGLKNGCRTLSGFNSQYLCIPNSASGDQAIRANDLTASKKNYRILRINIIGDAEVSDIVDPAIEPYLAEEFWAEAIPKAPRYAFGYDVARRHDLAAMWIDTEINNEYKQVAMITFENCKFESQKQLADLLLGTFGSMVGAGDETGLGGPNCEYLQTAYPDRFFPANFASLKNVLGNMLIEIFEQSRQELPLDPPEIGADLAGIRKDTTAAGKLCFTERANPYNAKSHCDMAWACALAKFAGETLEVFGPCMADPAGSTDDHSEERESRDRPDNSSDFDHNAEFPY